LGTTDWSSGRFRFSHWVKKWLLQWLQCPGEVHDDNLNNIRHEASRHFRNKKWGYMKDKINELAMNSKTKNIRSLYRGINKLKRLLSAYK
jgi:hypothetical protein